MGILRVQCFCQSSAFRLHHKFLHQSWSKFSFLLESWSKFSLRIWTNFSFKIWAPTFQFLSEQVKGSRDASKLLSQHAGCTVARVHVQVLVLVHVHVGLVHPWCRLEYFLVINKRPASNIQPHGKTDTAEMHEHQRNNAQRALNAHVWYHWLSTNNTRKPMASTTEVRNYLIFK